MIIGNLDEVANVRQSVLAAASRAAVHLTNLASKCGGLELLESLRFKEIGRHPTEDRALNQVEQINQTFTMLVSLAVVEWLLESHPNAAPFQLNPGTAAGTDILGRKESVAAEVFAAVRPGNNRKLSRDIEKVSRVAVAARYVFHYCPDDYCEPYAARNGAPVKVVPLTRANLMGDMTGRAVE
jgi:hypothetical protein